MNITAPRGEWRSARRRAFPRCHDFAEMVDELVVREGYACRNDDAVVPHKAGAVRAVLLHGEGGTLLHHPGTPLGAAGKRTSVQMPYG